MPRSLDTLLAALFGKKHTDAERAAIRAEVRRVICSRRVAEEGDSDQSSHRTPMIFDVTGLTEDLGEGQ